MQHYSGPAALTLGLYVVGICPSCLPAEGTIAAFEIHGTSASPAGSSGPYTTELHDSHWPDRCCEWRFAADTDP